jgi:hypothetical protein
MADDVARRVLLQVEGVIERTCVGFDRMGWTAALQEVDGAMEGLLAAQSHLQALLAKGRARAAGDRRVLPGSNAVQRNRTDLRYLCCRLCLAKAHLSSGLSLDLTDAVSLAALRDALILFPRSVEALHALALALKPLATSSAELAEIEYLWAKAVETKSQLVAGAGAGGDDDPDQADGRRRDWRAANQAQQQLCLYLCQNDRAAEAYPHMMAQGHTWRLSDAVLHYVDAATAARTQAVSTAGSGAATSQADPGVYLKAFDQVFSDAVLHTLRRCFRPTSPFWTEHAYDLASNSSRKVGYFSYLYPLRQRSAQNAIEQIVDLVFAMVSRQYPHVAAGCEMAEWWVHTRPHSSGHQLHFDSDETSLESGQKPQHPLMSTVIFVNNDLGGPTLVTDQLLGGGLATRGWLCHPQANRLCMFDSKFLHGVIPGRGINPDPRFGC